MAKTLKDRRSNSLLSSALRGSDKIIRGMERSAAHHRKMLQRRAALDDLLSEQDDARVALPRGR